MEPMTLHRLRWRRSVLPATTSLLVVAASACDGLDPSSPPEQSRNVIVVQPHAAIGDVVGQSTDFYVGLNNLRGIRFGPDGYIYVAEGISKPLIPWHPSSVER